MELPPVPGNPETKKERRTVRSDGVIVETLVHDKELGCEVATEIVFTDAEGHEVKFSSFLPSGWKFRPGEIFEVSPYDRTIMYGSLEEDSNLWMFMHEVGHANNTVAGKEVDEYGYNELIYPFLEKAKSGEVAASENTVQVDVYDAEKKVAGMPDEECYTAVSVPRKNLEEYAQIIARMERTASAYALNEIRKLRQKGVQVEGSMTLHDISDEMHSVLVNIAEEFERTYTVTPPAFVRKRFHRRNIDHLRSDS